MSEERRRPRKARSREIPITGISLFIAERKDTALQEHPELSRVQLFALLNDEWNTLDSAAKEPYERRADYSRRMESRRQNKKANDRPQLKVSAYSVFTRDRHAALKKSNPEMTVGIRAELIASEWKDMTPAQKVPFINAAKRETRKMQRPSDEVESSDVVSDDDSDT
jgi:hypothetical protein